MKNTKDNQTADGSPFAARTVGHLLDIGTHFCQALADGRYDDSPSRRAMMHGKHESRRPTDPLPKGTKFGGQIPMDDPLPNARDQGSAPCTNAANNKYQSNE